MRANSICWSVGAGREVVVDDEGEVVEVASELTQ